VGNQGASGCLLVARQDGMRPALIRNGQPAVGSALVQIIARAGRLLMGEAESRSAVVSANPLAARDTADLLSPTFKPRTQPLHCTQLHAGTKDSDSIYCTIHR
jgi:hypothetical protein